MVDGVLDDRSQICSLVYGGYFNFSNLVTSRNKKQVWSVHLSIKPIWPYICKAVKWTGRFNKGVL